MKLTVQQLARMVDLSAVRTDVDLTEVRQLAEAARRFRCICVFVLPCYVAELKPLLADTPEVGLGAVVGFPSGPTQRRPRWRKPAHNWPKGPPNSTWS